MHLTIVRRIICYKKYITFPKRTPTDRLQQNQQKIEAVRLRLMCKYMCIKLKSKIRGLLAAMIYTFPGKFLQTCIQQA